MHIQCHDLYLLNISFLFTSPGLSCFPQPGGKILECHLEPDVVIRYSGYATR